MGNFSSFKSSPKPATTRSAIGYPPKRTHGKYVDFSTLCSSILRKSEKVLYPLSYALSFNSSNLFSIILTALAFLYYSVIYKISPLFFKFGTYPVLATSKSKPSMPENLLFFVVCLFNFACSKHKTIYTIKKQGHRSAPAIDYIKLYKN